MIILPDTASLLRVVVGAGVPSALACIASFRDVTNTVYTPGRQLSAPPASTTTTIVAAPGSSVIRLVDRIEIYNANAAGASFTLQLFDGTNPHTVWRGVVPSGGRLSYTDRGGFSVQEATGIVVRDQIIDARSLPQDVWHTAFLRESVEPVVMNSGDYYPVGDLQIVVPAPCLVLLELSINVGTEATTTGFTIGVQSAPQFTPFQGTGGHGFGAATRRVPTATSADDTVFTSNITAANAPATSAVGADRSGGNLMRGTLIAAIPDGGVNASALLCVVVATEVDGSENTVMPGSCVSFAVHSYTP